MGPKLTRSLAVVVGVVAVLGSVHRAVAQNFPPDALAVRMPDYAAAVDVKAVVAIAIRLGVPVGFEEMGALADRVKGPFLLADRDEKRIVSVRPTLVDARGGTLREALDAVVVRNRRYEWHEMEGVVVVRPRAAWRDPGHPLLRPMPAERESGFSGGTLLDRLNAAVRAPGGMHWSLQSEISTILLDRGRAVTVSRPVVMIDGPAGSRGIPLWR